MPLIGRAKIVVPGGLHTACVATNKAVIACNFSFRKQWYYSCALWLFEDDSFILSSAEEGVLWSREEALSSILSAAILDMEAYESSVSPDHHVPSDFQVMSAC